MIEYNGVYGDFEWEIVGHINAINSEQAQWSAQAKIDLNLDLPNAPQGAPSQTRPQGARLHGLEAAKIDCSTGT
ncbi:MAG: hypothetical protein F4Z28_11435 [Gammaproteobacteria bacterium]|nr:hypothetical protein [Gammaproteobacteria bacterium]